MKEVIVPADDLVCIGKEKLEEVIRCKDCKYYRRNDRRSFIRGSDCSKEIIDTIVPDRDFCSKAERKEE